jgi:hypothetical protein
LIKKFILPLLVVLFIWPACAQNDRRSAEAEPKVTTTFYRLGDGSVRLITYQYGDVKDVLFINLHDDEVTSVEATKKLLAEQGGILIKIDNENERRINFKVRNKSYSIDPNRIFSRQGIIKTLRPKGKDSLLAIAEVERFASRISKLLPQEGWVIALHNNKDKGFSITEYQPGKEKERAATRLYVNQTKDPDDLFLTTDSSLYDDLAADGFNTVLENYDEAEKDGSLSIYCAEKKISYLNCETEHGRIVEYQDMIRSAYKHIRKKLRDQ